MIDEENHRFKISCQFPLLFRRKYISIFPPLHFFLVFQQTAFLQPEVGAVGAFVAEMLFSFLIFPYQRTLENFCDGILDIYLIKYVVNNLSHLLALIPLPSPPGKSYCRVFSPSVPATYLLKLHVYLVSYCTVLKYSTDFLINFECVDAI
jgi:hypothetical protein